MLTQPALSRDILSAALARLEAQKKNIEEHITQVLSLRGTAPKRRGRPPINQAAATPQQSAPRKRRKMSAAARKRLAQAMKKRWAAAKKAGRTALG